jgi:filamentous hemagglutinin
VDPSLLLSSVIGTEQVNYVKLTGAGGGDETPMTLSVAATLGDLLSPSGLDAANGLPPCSAGVVACPISLSDPVATSGNVTFYYYAGLVGGDGWNIAPPPVGTVLVKTATLALPTVTETTTTEQQGSAGVISAGGSIVLTAGALSNRGGELEAQGDVSLNIQSLSNGEVAPTLTNQVTMSVDQSQFSAFLAQLHALGSAITVEGSGNATGQFDCIEGQGCASGPTVPRSIFDLTLGATAPTATGTGTSSSAMGMIAAGADLFVAGGSLVNAGLMYAGNNVSVSAQSLTNQGGNSQSFSTQVGCAAGVPNNACAHGGQVRGENPTTTTFGYTQSDATIFAGNDLVIAAGQISNTYGNLIAGHDIVIGGVGTTATSTTPAQSLTNTSGNIIAGNNIDLNVSGAITNTLPPPVSVHENFGSQSQYAGCMTAGGYKESYCEAYVDQQSGSSSTISAGNSLSIQAGTLTNIGSLITAGTSATINVQGPIVNSAQTLNADWHSHWVQETGDFSSDQRHDVWACGSPAECAQIYGSAYTGGQVDPPTPVGNIAATIQAPNLNISSGGQIQNVGNVIGTQVTLTGQKLINGITTANTYTPNVNAPSQVISLSPLTMPGLNISVPRSTSSLVPTSVNGQAVYVEGQLGSPTDIGPQDLLNNLPANLQPSSAVFYYNPEEEDALLQQAALQQTGQASFVSGLTYDAQQNLSVTEQEKAVLYQNAVNYADANDLQVGTALTQTQINALTQPMLWYVEQTVPDPTCTATGVNACPTITALMPQIYLPSGTTALSAGGNIDATDVTLNFGMGSGGSIVNTGNITASNTLTVNTDSLTNQANQVNVGNVWTYYEQEGYADETGTVVQPGGFMSAANLDLNVQTLAQIGGAIQKLNSDGTIDQAGTAQLIASLQQQLGADFSQTTEANNLNTSFVQQGGFGAMQVFSMVVAVAVSIITLGAASELIGAELAGYSATFAAADVAAGTAAGLGNLALSAAIAGVASSVSGQLVNGGGIDWGSAFEMGAVSGITAGLTNGITYDSTNGFGFATAPQPITGGTSLASLAGANAPVGSATNQAIASSAPIWETRALAMLGEAGISAGVSTAIDGGSLATAFENALTTEGAAAGAFEIGQAFDGSSPLLSTSDPLYALAHAALGCAASAAEGTGCASGAVGGAISAALSPDVIKAIDPTGAPLTPEQTALVTALSMLVSGAAAGGLGANESGAISSAENEALNNATAGDHASNAAKDGGLLSGLYADVENLGQNPFAPALSQFWALVTHTGSPQAPSDVGNPLEPGSPGTPSSTATAGFSGAACVLLVDLGGACGPLVVSGAPLPSHVVASSSGDTNETQYPSDTSATNSGSVSDVNLASPDRTNHILNGDATGGGHLSPGAPGKSVFPDSWSASKVMNSVSDIATDPSIPETVQGDGRIVKNGTVDGIDIRVVIEPPSKGGGIVTAFPTNVPRNPK